MNKRVINIGLSLIFSTSLLVTGAEAGTTGMSWDSPGSSPSQGQTSNNASKQKDSDLPSSQTQSKNDAPNSDLPTSQTQSKNDSAGSDLPTSHTQSQNDAPGSDLPSSQTQSKTNKSGSSDADLIPGAPQESDLADKEEAKKKESTDKTQILVVPTVSTLGNIPSVQETELAPQAPATSPEAGKAQGNPFVESANKTPATQKDDQKTNVASNRKVHRLQGAVVDLTANSIIVRYKPYKKAAKKSRSAAKLSMAKMVKAKSQAQIITLQTKDLDPTQLESLEDLIFEVRKFTYETDQEGVHYVTSIQ